MRIAIIDAIGSFTKEIAEHWDSVGHEVSIYPEYQGEFLVNKDLVYFDWADQNLVRATQMDLPIPIVARLHSYEAFTDWPRMVHWYRVSQLIFVAPHVQKFVRHRFIPACPNRVIYNGIDLDKWEYKSRIAVEKPKVALIGEIGHKKGLQLLLDVAQQWKKAEFWIAGPVTDDRYFLMLNDMATKAGLAERVFYSGYVGEVNKYLNIFDYLICCSPWEGHNYSIMQAMAKGIKPLIYNFAGAEDLYPPECLWTSTVQVMELASGPYESAKYKQWLIDKNWTLEKQCQRFDEIIANPRQKTIEDVRDFYDTFVPILENDFQNPSPRLKAIENHVAGWITDKDEVVDMGCGVGMTTNWVSKRAKRVVGVDLSPELIASARNHFPKLEFVVGNVVNGACASWIGGHLPNTVCLFDCLEHILPEARPQLYERLKEYDKVLITLPMGQARLNGPLQIVDEKIDEGEIYNALPDHRVAYDASYDLPGWGKYRFIVLEKRKIVSPEDNSNGELKEIAVAV